MLVLYILALFCLFLSLRLFRYLILLGFIRFKNILTKNILLCYYIHRILIILSITIYMELIFSLFCRLEYLFRNICHTECMLVWCV